jgi:uncharacterized protein YbcV (DUF1398 family)
MKELPTRARRLFSVRSETKQNGSKILFASKRNRGVCFACFVLKQNSRFYMQNEKEMKRNETKEVKRKKQSKRNKAKISEKNILKRNEGKTASFFLRVEAKQKTEKQSKVKSTEAKQSEKKN